MDLFSLHAFCLAGCTLSRGLKNSLYADDQISAAQISL